MTAIKQTSNETPRVSTPKTRSYRFDFWLSGAMIMLAPSLLGAKGCEVATIGNDGDVCGGLTGASCSPDEFCNFPEEAICGAADATGTCDPVPEVCTREYAPVCGCDDKTYGNACEANAAGVSVASFEACDDGAQPSEPNECGGQLGTACDEREFCDFTQDAACGAADRTGTCRAIPEVCTKEYAPVCGCDDKTYGNACEANAAGVAVARPGECESEPSPGTVGMLCGTRGAGECSKGEFCNFPESSECGETDKGGACERLPEACREVYDPVCGCDDETYGNACEANAAGISVAEQGECEQEPTPGCGGPRGLPCEAGEFCNYPPEAICGAADALGECEPVPEACDGNYDPVCGCDDKTYGNECQAHAAGISVIAEGECEAPPGQVCGGIAAIQCDAGEYCSYAIESECGAGDMSGTCEVIPEVCTKEYRPVCGCNGETYGNPCMAAAAGVSVASSGECASVDGETCGGLLGATCDKGEFCNYPSDAACGFADATGICETIPEVCTEEYEPVCGCDGATYGNACNAHAAGVSVAAQGECEPAPSGEICGGLQGLNCQKDQYCAYSIEAMCGAADATGNCATPPEACIALYAPVCGCDDRTYGNACEAAMAGVSVAVEGECGSSGGAVCGGLLGGACADGEFCSYPTEALCGAADATGICAPIPMVCPANVDPVCGCDGKTYGNGCTANAAGVSVASEGDCQESP